MNFMRRYSTSDESILSRTEDDADRKCCFTDNYLVFNLGANHPQLTQQYLDQEDNVLDYCKTVNFNRNAPQPLDRVMEDPTEIDGDACLAVVTPGNAPEEDLNQSMFLTDHLD